VRLCGLGSGVSGVRTRQRWQRHRLGSGDGGADWAAETAACGLGTGARIGQRWHVAAAEACTEAAATDLARQRSQWQSVRQQTVKGG